MARVSEATRGAVVGLGLVVTIAALAAAQPAAPPSDFVRTDKGFVAGAVVARTQVRAFKGIPFAAPPVGDLRWRPPQPAAAWEGVRRTEAFSAACMQETPRSRNPWTAEFMVQEDVSEDCLYLNVWTGVLKTPGGRPVLVYIHGGAYREGSGAVSIYDGTALASKGLLVVTINYRLGVFGFMAHPALTAESPNRGSGNYGLLDVIAALKWVQTNIAAFGGDPNRVTIAGQSAGAGAVHALVASPLAKGLFHRAIAQSGSGITGLSTPPLADGEKTGTRLAATLQATDAKALRAVPAADVLAAVSKPGPDPLVFRPIVDGWFLPTDAATALAAGTQHDVPILTGLTADEGSSSPTYGRATMAQYAEQAGRFEALADRFRALYPATTDEEAGAVTKTVARDRGIASMALWAERRAKSPATSTAAFTYYLTRAIPWPEHPEFGAFHSSDLPYVFNNLHRMDRPWEDVDRTLAATVSGYWINFVTTGDPNGGTLPRFPAFSAAARQTMELGATVGARETMSAEKAAFWRDAFALPPSRPRGSF